MDCSHCATLVCQARTVVEHGDGTIECDEADGVCAAPAHAKTGVHCADAEPRQLVFDCGACWSTSAGY